MQDRREDEFEAYLKQFRFQDPPPLRMMAPALAPQRHWALRWAGAVAALLLVAVFLWTRSTPVHPTKDAVREVATATSISANTKPEPMTLGRLSVSARENREELNGAFMDAAAESLPDVARRGGVLQILAGD